MAGEFPMQSFCNCCGGNNNKDSMRRRRKSNARLAALRSLLPLIGTVTILGAARSASAGLVPPSVAVGGRTEGKTRVYGSRHGSNFGGGADGRWCLSAVRTVRGGASGESSEAEDQDVSFVGTIRAMPRPCIQ